jgi:transposase-like protein
MYYSEEEKARWLENWEQSGKSIIAFTRENNLVRWTFTRWLKAARSSKMSFVEVTAQVKPALQQTPEILIEKGDMKIHIPLLLEYGGLRAVMEGLGGVL